MAERPKTFEAPKDLASVRAIVVAWNAGRYLDRCITSLLDQRLSEPQVWVVDHGSTDGSVEQMAKRHPGVNVLVHSANRSYGEAVNLAANRCGGAWLLIANPDTALLDGSLQALLDAVEDNRCAAVGPRLQDAAGRDVTRFQRTHFVQAVAALSFPGLLSGWRNRLQRGSRSSTLPRPVEFLEASIMLVRRSAFESIGGFDEQFTFYGEDADLCRSLRRCGYQIIHAPRTIALHEVSGTFAAVPDRQRASFLDGLMLSAWKRSLRRYRWKRRLLLAFLSIGAAWERAHNDRRADSTQNLCRRILEGAYLPAREAPEGGRVTMAVVVPTFQRPAPLDRALESLAEQTDPDFEVVIVVQGDSTGIPGVIERWSPRMRVRRLDLPFANRGAAKNAGARSVDADIVLFLDDDAIAPVDLIEVHRRAFRDPQCAAVSCRVVEGESMRDEGEDRLRLTWYGRIVANVSSRRSGPAGVAACGNMSFRRRTLLSFGGFDPSLRGTGDLEEFDVAERILAEGWTIWFDASTTVRHVPQPGGNLDRRSSDAIGAAYDLHHNLSLIFLRHRPMWTWLVAAVWAGGRSVRKALRSGHPVRAALRIWSGFAHGLVTYRRDQR